MIEIDLGGHRPNRKMMAAIAVAIQAYIDGESQPFQRSHTLTSRYTRWKNVNRLSLKETTTPYIKSWRSRLHWRGALWFQQTQSR